MKPETLAGVWARPAVCRIWATPYTQPSTTPAGASRGVSRPSARGASRTRVTLAIAKRTARKSRVGTRSSRSWMRKNVEPQQAVTARRAAVASSVVRRGPGTAERYLGVMGTLPPVVEERTLRASREHLRRHGGFETGARAPSSTTESASDDLEGDGAAVRGHRAGTGIGAHDVPEPDVERRFRRAARGTRGSRGPAGPRRCPCRAGRPGPGPAAVPSRPSATPCHRGAAPAPPGPGR